MGPQLGIDLPLTIDVLCSQCGILMICPLGVLGLFWGSSQALESMTFWL